MKLPSIEEKTRDRITSVLGTGIFHALLIYAFIMSSGLEMPPELKPAMKIFSVAEPLPPPAQVPPPTGPMTRKKRTPKPEGAASPPNLKDTPKPVAAPPPKIPLPVLNPLPAAPIAGQGNAAAAGAARVPGPGTGSGGQGIGTGSGRFGNGTGGGGGGGGASRARWVSGRILDSDYPRKAYESGAGGVVSLRFVVGPSGRVTRCNVTRSSGRGDLDAATCRLILQRFRYRPARDEWGRAVPDTIIGEHEWQSEFRQGPMIELEEEEGPG
ncbi:MAG: energy transducer TonB [Sphingosinicella sp.]|nr:energy transducer TonB [Sphingosinicella sp.]